MIFFTVGTHEQPFDRAVEALDRLKGEKVITEDVFIQTGYSAYVPHHCRYADFIGFNQILQHIAAADMVITHGGTGSIMLVLYNKKIPIVIPRQKKYNEHIDDHQVAFCRMMEAKGKIVAVYDTNQLAPALVNYRQAVSEIEASPGVIPQPAITERAAEISRQLTEICNQWFAG